MKLIEKAYALFLRVANASQSVFLLAVRLYWGWQLWQTGRGKLSDIPKVIDYFTSLGVPAPAFNAHFIAWLEAVGGVLLVLGLGARLISVPLVIDMIVAYDVGDHEALTSLLSDPDKFSAAAPFTFLFASLLVLLFGPGWFSLDSIIAWFHKKRQPASAAAEPF
jgi:putative oxidoreductase